MLDWMKKYKRTLLYGGLTLLACLLLAGSIALFVTRPGEASSLEAAKESETNMPETESQELKEAEATGDIAVAFAMVGLQKDVNELLSVSAKLRMEWKVEEEKEEEIEIPEIKVAPVNDKEDPEKDKAKEEADKGTSEEVSIEDIIHGSGEQSGGNQSEDSQGGGSSEAETSGGGSGEGSGVSYGIDVSKWQGNINWQKVAQSGVEFAIIRCGYRGNQTGEIVMDPYFKKNISGALSQGIPVGVYFYSQSIDEAEARQEAAWVAEVIKNYDITYPVVFDYEGIGQNRIKDVTKTQRTNNALAFMDQIRKEGYTPMMYASKNGYNNNWETSRFTNCKIWLAHYTTGGKPSNYTGHYDMWQYTSKGVVPGISGYVDMNIAYFRYSNHNSTGKVKEVTCQVTDFNGAPIAGATVTLSGTLKYTAVTGADGIARFSDIRLDTYRAEVTAVPSGYSLDGSNAKDAVIGKAQDKYDVGTMTVQKQKEPDPTEPETGESGGADSGEGSSTGFDGVTVKDASGYIMVTGGSVNVRSLPDSSGTKYGTAHKNDIFAYSGICSNGWYRITYNGKTAYISGSYSAPCEAPAESSAAVQESGMQNTEGAKVQ